MYLPLAFIILQLYVSVAVKITDFAKPPILATVKMVILVSNVT